MLKTLKKPEFWLLIAFIVISSFLAYVTYREKNSSENPTSFTSTPSKKPTSVDSRTYPSAVPAKEYLLLGKKVDF